eukprot:6158557-Prymnesium_polylepis.1
MANRSGTIDRPGCGRACRHPRPALPACSGLHSLCPPGAAADGSWARPCRSPQPPRSPSRERAR